MPEGDTVYLAAKRLDAAFGGRALTSSDFRIPALATATMTGERIEQVRAYGKHLLFRFDNSWTLHTHFRMDGTWHLYRSGERWRGGPGHQIRIVLSTEHAVAVGYRLHDVALLPTDREEELIGHLGPDILDDDWHLEAALERLAAIAEGDETLVNTEPVGVHDIARQAWISVDTGDTRLVTRDATDRILEANKARLRELFEHLFRLVVDDETVPAVVVGVTDDGFCLTQYDPEADTEAVDALETEPDATERVASHSAVLDGADDVGAVERIADMHGWSVDIVEDNGQVAVVCRGVADGERALPGI